MHFIAIYMISEQGLIIPIFHTAPHTGKWLHPKKNIFFEKVIKQKFMFTQYGHKDILHNITSALPPTAQFLLPCFQWCSYLNCLKEYIIKIYQYHNQYVV